MSVPVFRKGTWIHYTIPVSMNPLWSESHIFQAASFYATALSQGEKPSDSSIYAEAYINKHIYPGIQYNKALEIKLQQIMDRVERA